MKMGHVIWMACLCILALDVNASAVGKAWDISPSSASETGDQPSWPGLESSNSGSAFEVRSVSGMGRLSQSVASTSLPHKPETRRRSERKTENDFEDEPEEHIEGPDSKDFLRNRRELENAEEYEEEEAWLDYERMKRNIAEIVEPTMHHFTIPHIDALRKPRVRREADKNMEKISATKNVREARLNSPETWSKQPISVEFRRHPNSDQSIYEKDIQGSRNHQAPKTDFVTGHRRDYPDSQESREMPSLARAYPDYVPLYHEKVRERDFDVPIPRRYYSDRFRTERGFDMRRPIDDSYYYNRYNEEDINPYGRAYTPSKPKRIIYYAHLPEVARKPVDLRSYRYPYDDMVRSPPVAGASSTSYTRAPGNVDPNNYRYRSSYPYDAYRPYRRDPYRRPYDPLYQSRLDDDRYMDRAALKEDSRNSESLDRKIYGPISDRDEGRLPWPVHIGTEVSVKDDERIPGRRIFGQNDDYNRYQVNAKLQTVSGSGNSNDDQKIDN